MKYTLRFVKLAQSDADNLFRALWNNPTEEQIVGVKEDFESDKNLINSFVGKKVAITLEIAEVA